MASDDEIPMWAHSSSKYNFLVQTRGRNRELTLRQREYKKTLSLRLKTRYEQILERSYVKAISRLQSEQNELRARIWVANGQPHKTYTQRNLDFIECQVNCQGRLGKELKNLKIRISNMEREIGRVNKEIYELNRKTVPESQHQTYVASQRKCINILDNRIETGVRRESELQTINATLREELTTLLEYHSKFHCSYTKLVQMLNAGKKYFVDLLEYCTNTFEGLIDVNEKTENAENKLIKDHERDKLLVQSIMRNLAATELVDGFTICKNRMRPLADLQPSEYRRRKSFKHSHVHKITVYNSVLAKLYGFTGTFNVRAVIEKYQEHESLYYSYFSLSNELSLHMTLLKNAANRLLVQVTRTKLQNRFRKYQQVSNLKKLEAKLAECQKRNEQLNLDYKGVQNHWESVFESIASIFNLCRADATPMIQLLGDHTRVHLYNLHGFLKVFEMRILNIVRNIYVQERENKQKSIDKYVVQEIFKAKELRTDLNDIVLAQQCPECAEGETFYMDDSNVAVASMEETQKALFEKVNQPEMQYRLHSISKCRLARSRLLAAKRNG